MTVQLAPAPVFQGWSQIGTPLAGGLLYTYQAGTTTPQATYVDSTQTTPNTNPVQLNAYGQANVWLVANQTYKLTLTDSAGNQLYSVDQIPGGQSFTQQSLGQILYPQTPAEIAASVVPVNFFYQPGNINRYGTNSSPGSTDMSLAFSQAIAQASQASGAAIYFPAGSYNFLQTATFNLTSSIVIYGDGPSSILTFTTSSGILGSGVNDCIVRNLQLNSVNGTVGPYSGIVAFTSNSTFCKVLDCEIIGAPMFGVLLQDTIRCTVAGNYIHGDSATVMNGDGGGIMLRGTSGGCLYNIVRDNQITTNSVVGIEILTGSPVPASTGLNKYNLVIGNRVGGAPQEYGILGSYSGNGTYDLFNSIIDNYIENVLGTYLSGSSGAGIYVVGAGGIKVQGNTISNCCQQTSVESLAPAAIGISSTVTGLSPVDVIGNTIANMTKYYGVDVTNCTGPVNVSSNTISHPASNVTGTPIKINGSSNTKVQGNTIYNAAAEPGIWLHIAATSLGQIDISDNQITNNTAAIGILSDVTSGSATWVTISNNNIVITGAQSAINLSGLAQTAMVGNVINTGAAAGIVISACTRTRMSGNCVVCTSTTFAFSTSGTCTDSYADESNYFDANGTTGQGAVTNGATGFLVTQFGTANPTVGAHVVGDTWINSAPTATSTDRSRCTTAGSGAGATWTGLTLP